MVSYLLAEQPSTQAFLPSGRLQAAVVLIARHENPLTWNRDLDSIALIAVAIKDKGGFGNRGLSLRINNRGARAICLQILQQHD